jgi:hypothetical protein
LLHIFKQGWCIRKFCGRQRSHAGGHKFILMVKLFPFSFPFFIGSARPFHHVQNQPQTREAHS